MRHIVLPIAALLFSNVAFASNAACSNDSNPKSRLACYDKMAATIDECQSQQDQLDRLVCFDNLSSAFKSAFAANADGASLPAQTAKQAPAAVIAPSAAQEASFGAAEIATEKLEEITSIVSKVSTDPYKKWTLTLENGQRWKQIESDRVKIKAGDTVTIKRASFGSFLLTKQGTSRTSRVKRL